MTQSFDPMPGAKPISIAWGHQPTLWDRIWWYLPSPEHAVLIALELSAIVFLLVLSWAIWKTVRHKRRPWESEH
ncbi:MAG: hypothetical protein ACRET2_09325 [Steroidobacteraceae bacterium]